MYIEKSCEHFVYQNDRNGEFAIGCCSKMTGDKDHEGNYGQYSCPLLKEKYRYKEKENDNLL